MPMPQTVFTQIVVEPHATIVRITGEIRLLVDTVERELTRVMLSRAPLVLIDLSGLSFCSSLGMGSLVSFRRGATRLGTKVALCAMQPIVLDSFKRARLHDLFEIRETLDAAPAAAPSTAV